MINMCCRINSVKDLFSTLVREKYDDSRSTPAPFNKDPIFDRMWKIYGLNMLISMLGVLVMVPLLSFGLIIGQITKSCLRNLIRCPLLENEATGWLRIWNLQNICLPFHRDIVTYMLDLCHPHTIDRTDLTYYLLGKENFFNSKKCTPFFGTSLSLI